MSEEEFLKLSLADQWVFIFDTIFSESRNIKTRLTEIESRIYSLEVANRLKTTGKYPFN